MGLGKGAPELQGLVCGSLALAELQSQLGEPSCSLGLSAWGWEPELYVAVCLAQRRPAAQFLRGLWKRWPRVGPGLGFLAMALPF